MYIARTSALGWSRSPKRWRAIAEALENSSLGRDREVEVEVFETDAAEPYVDQMGAVRIDPDDEGADDPELEQVEGLTLSPDEAELVSQLTSATAALETDVEGLLRGVVLGEDANLYRESIVEQAEAAKRASRELERLRD